jgi:hypothetical protein
MSTLTACSPEDSRATLRRSLESAALRQTATLRAASAAVAHAPTLDDCAAAVERMREELEYLEDSSDLYRELFDAELTEQVASATAKLPRLDSWLEACIAQLVLCLASQLEATQRLAEDGSESLLRRLAQENEHVDAARAALREHCAQADDGSASAALECWLPVAFETLELSMRLNYLDALRRHTVPLGIRFEARNTVAA